MQELTDDEWADLARDLARRVSVTAPGWTDQNESDPGVTIVELVAFLGQSLLVRTGPSDPARARISDALKRLEAAASGPCADLPSPTRVRYFEGQLLSAADFEQEQGYLRDKHRRHNLALHGTGIAWGLDVSVQPGDAQGEPGIAVSPGVAIGPDGEELVVCERMTSPLCADRSRCYVVLRLVDRPARPVPTESGQAASRIEEVVEVAVLEKITRQQLAIGRVERVGDTWRVDPAFKPPRLAR